MKDYGGLHSNLSYKIIGAVRTVYAGLGAGFVERVYQNALVIELCAAGLSVEQAVPIDVYYRNARVGKFFADVLVEGKILIELKAVELLLPIHGVQLVNYLKATDVELGLLVNFGPKLEIERKIFTNDRKKSRSDSV